MSYIFSSNGNNYTFKKLDNMLINMPEKDGHHVLIRETVDGVPQYSWGSASCIVKANEAFVFEYTPEVTESFNAEWAETGQKIPNGKYLVTTQVLAYLNEDLFNDCKSIEDVISKEYYVQIAFGSNIILEQPFVDSLNTLCSFTGYKVIEINEGESMSLRFFSNMPLVLLGGTKAVTIVFELLGSTSVQ